MRGNRLPPPAEPGSDEEQTTAMTTELATQTFKAEVIDAATPYLVDFYATWCGPCRNQAPILDALAAEFDGKVGVGKVDVDKHPDVARMFNVQSMPTMLLFKRGRIVERFIGLTDGETLAEAMRLSTKY